MKLSSFGTKMTSKTGILQLMDDLGKAMAGGDMLSLGGGNPAHIPEMESVWRREMQHILGNGREFEEMLGNYTTPQGDGTFTKTVAAFFQKNYNWKITERNVAILGGSQTSFFFLFNMLAGLMPDGSKSKILLPIIPEYIGYADQGMTDDFFIGNHPHIELYGDHSYKYGIDFDTLEITPDVAAVAISRPTNPTGNVITDEEVARLAQITKEAGIPFILDNAYGLPFPGILFTDAKPIWEDHMIYVMSLSKIGLPSLRTSIVIASEEVVEALASLNAIISLSTGTVGQHIIQRLLESGEILSLAKEVIQPFYAEKSKKAQSILSETLRPDIPWRLHKSEGALFLWLWYENMPITSLELYDRLKKRGVIVVPGEYFFPGMQGTWQHAQECIRISFSMKDEVVERGLRIISEEINALAERVS